MSRLIFLILLLASPALAQQANLNYLGTQVSVTIVTASALGVNAFVHPGQLPQASGRQSCLIQYRPATNPALVTPQSFGFVFFGQAAPATTLSAFAMTAFSTLSCEAANEVDGDAIWLAATNTNDSFTIKVK